MNNIEEMIPFLKEAFAEGKDFKMPIKGTSMLPFLNETMKVSLTLPQNLRKNDMIFYRRDDGHYVLHRIRKVHDDTYDLLGDNQCVIEKGLRKDQVLGKVNHVYLADGKEKKLKGPGYSFYLFFWNWLLFRRVMIKLRSLGKKK